MAMLRGLTALTFAVLSFRLGAASCVDESCLAEGGSEYGVEIDEHIGFVQTKKTKANDARVEATCDNLDRSSCGKYSCCDWWYSNGYCSNSYYKWMEANCAQSCDKCQASAAALVGGDGAPPMPLVEDEETAKTEEDKSEVEPVVEKTQEKTLVDIIEKNEPEAEPVAKKTQEEAETVKKGKGRH